MLLKKGSVKRIMCAVLTCALALAPVTPASAATARATTMKLEKKEGTVTLKTQSGTTLRITNGMRLYNGNSLATGKKSYAYVSLDSAKAVKLDQSSSATLRQSGKNLELLVKSGKLFFNVSKPLTKKENMNVRTSTMVTGIRGTCGVVEAVTQTESKLYLIEGKVTMGTGENAVTIEGGQTATVVLDTNAGTDQPGKPGDAHPQTKQTVKVAKLTENEIPAVALEEIANDTALQQKIEQTTDLDIDKIKEAFEQFQKEESGQDDQKDDTKTDTKDEEKKDDDQSGSSSGGSSSSSSTPDVTQKETTLTGIVTSGAIQAAFAQYDKVHIGFKSTSSGTLNLESGEILEVPVGKQLMLWGNQTLNQTIKVAKGGLFCVPEGATVTGKGTLQLAAGSTLEAHGTLELMQLTSDGGAVIKNTNTIRIFNGYTSGGTDQYDGTYGVLISQTRLTALPEKWLLMTDDGHYFYADTFCKHVIENMNSANQYNFSKNADIPAGTSVELDNFRAQMNGNELRVAGSLKLNGHTNITGSGNATIRLNGGTLELAEKNESPASGLYMIENTGNGYAIACNSGTFKWNNPDVRVKSGAQNVAIQGATKIEGTTDQRYSMQMPSYCHLKQGYRTWCDTNTTNNTLMIGLELDTSDIPSEFNKGDSVNIEQLNAALQQHGTVTVDDGVTVEASSESMLSIPENATLIMNGVMNEVGSVFLFGTLEVGESGTVRIKSLSLGNQAAIKNNHLIKINTVMNGSGSVACNYSDPGQKGVLVVGGDHLLGNTFNGSSWLASALSSDYQSLECIYAAGMTQLVADQMQPDQIIDGQTISLWNFAKHAVVSGHVVWNVAGTSVGMAANELQIATGASLTLKNIGDIGGTGSAVIRVGTGAHLIVEGAVENVSGIYRDTEGYVIALDEVDASAASVTADITLSGANLSLAATTAEKIIQGMGGSEILPDFVKIADIYQWKVTQGEQLWTLTLENK